MSEKKKGGWKSLFVTQAGGEEEEATAQTTAVPTTAPVSSYTPSYVPSTPTGNPSAFEGKLREAVNSQATEYVKFKRANDELKSVLPDEGTRMKSAFVSMKAMGITKDVLVSTAKASLSLIVQEQSDFEGAMAAAFNSQVEGGVSRLTTIDKQIEEKLAQVSALQAEVDRMRTEKSKVSSEVEQSRSKIDSARRDFAAAYGKLTEEINSDINKISTSL